MQRAVQRLLNGRLPPSITAPDPVAATHAIVAPSESMAAADSLRTDAVEKRADLLEDAARRSDIRADEIERRVDSVEGDIRVLGQRLAYVETLVSEVDGFRMARARQIEGHDRLAERFASSVASLLRRFDELQQEMERLRSDRRATSSGVMPSGALDALYLAFENRLRGTRAEIKERQAEYLELVHDAEAGTVARPILDLGAGRGEWLEVLRDHGLAGRGIDLNGVMVALCRDLGLDCSETDVRTALAALPDASLGMITGFHIIEHLPFEMFVLLLDEGLRVLAPGGLLLLETPDPQNMIVGSHTFYMDPTHRNPMPSLMVSTIAEARGYERVEIRRLRPSPSRFTGIDTELIDQLNAQFFGPQDYILIARKGP